MAHKSKRDKYLKRKKQNKIKYNCEPYHRSAVEAARVPTHRPQASRLRRCQDSNL